MGSKTLHQRKPPVLNWLCRLTLADLYSGHKTVVVVGLTQQKIVHFGDVLPSQSPGLVLIFCCWIAMVAVCLPLKCVRYISRDVSTVWLGRLHCGRVQFCSLIGC